jgi:DNA-binding response OmpR family regulator
VKITAGLLTDNPELADDLRDNCRDTELILFRSPESLRRDNFDILFIDLDIFESDDLIQFYLSKYRKKIHEIPVVLIIRVSSAEKIQTDWFFDELIVYPFRKGELPLRLRLLLKEKTGNENIITTGNMRIHLEEYSVYLNNEKLELTYKEFELLRLLVENKGVVFSRKDLLSKIWGMEYIGGTRTVDVHIRRLRGKLGDDFNSIIETVRNVGYKCIA